MWLCTAISIILGLPILKLDVVFNAIISLSTIGWVGGYAVQFFARLVMAEENFKPGPFIWVKQEGQYVWWPSSGYVIPVRHSYCQQPTPSNGEPFNYAPIIVALAMTPIMLWWFLDARKWFKGPVRDFVKQDEDI